MTVGERRFLINFFSKYIFYGKWVHFSSANFNITQVDLLNIKNYDVLPKFKYGKNLIYLSVLIYIHILIPDMEKKSVYRKNVVMVKDQ